MGRVETENWEVRVMNAYRLCFQTGDKETLNPDAHGTRHRPRDCLVKKCVGFNEVFCSDVERAVLRADAGLLGL